ncbi:hypothetical protein [Rufibacter latericius]|nr:hypothetical protein [Rufibacter latericius]
MNRNENHFLLLGLLLREAKEHQLKKSSTQAAFDLLDEIKKTISIINCEDEQDGIALLELGSASKNLSVAEGLLYQGKVTHALTLTKFKLTKLLNKAPLFGQP